MAADAHPPSPHAGRRLPTLGPAAALGLAGMLFAGIFALRSLPTNPADADEVLFVLPIALLALRFGLRGGLAGALIALALAVAWDAESHGAGVSIHGYVTRGLAFVVLGALLGEFVDKRRMLEGEALRNFDASLDLLAVADGAGHLTRVNPAWERVLGHSPQTICSRPFIEFVHPDDRDATIAETAALASGERDTIGFRNRYRAADGDYRWLEWSARAGRSGGVIHAVAREVSAQHEAERQHAVDAETLEVKVAERTRELDAARAETLQRLALAAEYRDDATSQHTQRVGATAAEVGARLGLDSQQVATLREAAPLHDVGKLAIPDTILLKPGKLSVEEYELMKTHATLGARLLSGSSSPVLQMAAVIAASHHERWDGEGYPAGLVGEAIPLVGRIVAVADVFDALTHDRPYKSLWPVEQAISEIRRAAGTQFDPEVVAAFMEMHSEGRGPDADEGAQRSLFARQPRRERGGVAAPPRPVRHA
jgi:PAS domain S-box-containing protein